MKTFFINELFKILILGDSRTSITVVVFPDAAHVCCQMNHDKRHVLQGVSMFDMCEFRYFLLENSVGILMQLHSRRNRRLLHSNPVLFMQSLHSMQCVI